MSIKQKLYNHCQEFVNNKLKLIEKTIQSNKEGLSSETKSSAGDKHETGRAMLQLEMEKAGQQLKVVHQMQQQLERINLNSTSKKIHLGSIVKTNSAVYFLAIGMGQITMDKIVYSVISTNSPIGQLLLGKEEEENVFFRNQKIKVLEVL